MNLQNQKGKCWILTLTVGASLHKHLQKDSVVEISWRIIFCSCLFWPCESFGMRSVGCGGVAAVSNVAAVNSLPDLEFSSPRAGPRQEAGLNRLPSALCPDSCPMFPCCSLPGSLVPDPLAAWWFLVRISSLRQDSAGLSHADETQPQLQFCPLAGCQPSTCCCHIMDQTTGITGSVETNSSTPLSRKQANKTLRSLL